jgi:DNA processing protein
VENADQVLAELAPLLRGLIAAPPAGATRDDAPRQDPVTAMDSDYRRLLDAMGYEAMAMDELVSLTGLPVPSLSSMLLVLELEGHVSSAPGGRYCRVR